MDQLLDLSCGKLQSEKTVPVESEAGFNIHA